MISPLSQSQLSIFLASQGLDANTGNYQQASLYPLPDTISLDRLKTALEALVMAHPYILSRIVDKDGMPWMETPDHPQWEAPVIEVDGIEQARGGFATIMDLYKDPLFRLEIYKTREGNYLYIDFHHIIFDGASVPVFTKDLADAFDGKALKAEAFSGADIALQEQQARESEAYADAKAWFAQEFGPAADLESKILPDLYGQAPLPYKELFLKLDLEAAAMREVTAAYRYAESVLVSAAFGLTLAAWNAEEKAAFATIWNGRKGAQTRGSITMCVHTQPVYVEAAPQTPLADVLERMKAQTIGLRNNGFYSFADAVSDLGLNLPVNFAYQGQFVGATLPLVLDGKQIQGQDLRTNPPGIGLSMEFFSAAEGPYALRFWYRPDQYSPEILENLAGSLTAVIKSMAQAKTVGELAYCTKEQVRQLEGFQPALDQVDTSLTPVDLFRANAAKYPKNKAVVYKDVSLTYEEVDRLSDNLAAYIQGKVKPGSVVSIILGRNQYMMLAPLGVLKAGCAYEPLDPSYPQERLEFMVKDASCALLIADDDLVGLLPGFDGPVLRTSEIGALPEGKPEGKPLPEDLFILLYTSGTTGTPKGCMLTHRNISAYAQRNGNVLGLDAGCRMTAYASFGFDAFMNDLFTALAAGCTLYVIPEELRLDLPALSAYYEEQGITHCFMTTQVATQFALNYPESKTIRALFTGGEKMPSFTPPKYRLLNCYGPTETSVYVVYKDVKRQEENVPIGKPLPGVHAYVAGKNGARVPAGALGELLVSGEQVGDGYWGRPDKTAEVFMDNPYEKDPVYRKLYRTGDIVRYREDGDIEYVGRKDGMVKIRGFRIELKEVEGVIREFPLIKDATVQAFDEPGEGGGKFLAAYVVSPEPIDISALQAFIAERKPPYMVPPVVMQIDAIPLNVNQKVDRKALPKPEMKSRSEAVGAPLNVLEEELAALVRESAGIEGFSLTDPLFYYGLSSLSALRLATELFKRYGVQMDTATFAKTATLQTIENEVLKVLMAGGGKKADHEEEVTEPQELTFQQTGVFFDCVKVPSSTVYNIPMAWAFPEGTSPEALQKAALSVLEAHPSLRCHFQQKDGKVYQVPDSAAPEVSLVKTEDYKSLKENFMQPFNLQEGPLYRVCAVEAPEGVFLLTDFHHLVFDGRSYDVFLEQLTAALEGKAPQKESYGYLHYAKDQKAAVDSPAFKEAQAFFASRMDGFEEASTVLPDKTPEEGAKGHEVFITKKVGAQVAARCRSLGISAASYYLGATAIALSAFCGRQKVFLCTISNGRSDLRTADTLGMFVNTLALSAQVGEGRTDQFLRQTDKDFAATLSYENYPFSRVAADYGFQPQLMLAYQVGVLTRYTVDGQPVKSENLEIGVPKFPLSLFIDGVEGEEYLALAYDDSLYSEALVKSFLDCVECVLRGLMEDKDLTDIQLVDGEALARLDGFNPQPRPEAITDTVVSLFRAQAAATPEAPAVFFEGDVLTYRELDRKTDRIAAYLHGQGLKAEDVVSILIGRNSYMVTASLGVLKAGCAYQPLDPSYPQERLNFMVKDADAKLLIADEDLIPLLSEFHGPVLTTAQLETLPEGKVPAGPRPEDLFTLLYTSGSTGTPKGCILEHRNLAHFCDWYRRYYHLKPGDKVAAYASYGFDANMMDMYPAVTTGACVYIVAEQTRHDMSLLNAFLEGNGVTHSFMTTQVGVMYAKNFPDNPCLKHLSVGGEKLVSIDPPSYHLYNGYGPTECTIFSTIFQVKEKEPNIPIGGPLDGVQLYVTDKNLRRLPVGAAGELLICGDGVGRGYLNRPDKTAECFLESPFIPGVRAYRSGDVVRYRNDGNIEFVGRKDGQVKIRGFRVELKEVEAVIRDIPGVKDATVQAFDSPSGGKFLAAYVVADGKFDTKAAGDFIRQRKPPYMVPASFMQLERIPLNVNNKVDRKALPSPTPAAVDDYVAPKEGTETILCEIFAEVLGTDRVGALDNFFDLGGTSLLVTNVLVNAEKRGLRFAYADVFAHPTARSLAGLLDGEDSGAAGEDTDIVQYDYSAINGLLAQNTLDSLRNGERQPVGGQILLTGATGFLGIHMLRELVDNTSDDSVIWCLLRRKGSISPERRLTEMLVYYFEKRYRSLIGQKIRLIEGDITDQAVFDALRTNGTAFDLVINCAANVKHFSKGTDIEDINYGGVKNLVAFCEGCGARFIQVSTESVAGLSLGDTPREMTEQMLYFGQQTDNQYIHSKFLAERHILQHMADGTLNAKILRAGNLSPRSSDGEFQVNLNSNAAMGRIKAYKMMGACPYALLEGRMEFSPIDDSARAMVLLAATPRENCVFNVSNDHYIPMDDILSRLEKIDGKPVEYVEYPEFVQRLEAMKADPEKARVLSSLLAYAQAPTHQEAVMNPAATNFTMQVLHRLGFRWDHTSSYYLDQMFEMLRTLQYFER